MSTPDGYNGQTLPVAGTGGAQTRVVEENDVVYNGEIIGSDPDANVRLALLKQAGGTSADSGGDAGGGN